MAKFEEMLERLQQDVKKNGEAIDIFASRIEKLEEAVISLAREKSVPNPKKGKAK